MRKLLLVILFAFIAVNAYAKHDSTYSYIGIDSSSSTVHDTIPSSTLEQHIDSVFMALDTEDITTGLLTGRFHNL